MSLFTFIFALIFVAVGLCIAVVVSWQILAPILHLVRGKSSVSRPRKKSSSKLKKADALIEKGRLDDALKLLRKAFLVSSPTDPQGIARLKELNQDILSRVLLIAEERGGRAEHLSEVEHCLMERIELLNLLSKASESFKNLRTRREKAGKEFPSWSKADFESRIKEIRTELLTNENNLQETLNVLFKGVSQSSQDEKPITYH